MKIYDRTLLVGGYELTINSPVPIAIHGRQIEKINC